MTTPPTNDLTTRKPLRLWPGVLAVVLQWLGWFILPMVVPGATIYGVFAGLIGGLVVVFWWLFFSRAPWSERVGAIVLMPVAVFATSRIGHESIADGMMGMMLPVSAIPGLSVALVAWAVTSRRLARGPRRAWMIGAILLACGAMTLVRTGGISGEGGSDLHWRWTETPEERLLAHAGDEPAALPPAPIAATPEKGLPAQASEAPTAHTSTPAAAEASEKQVPVSAGEEAPVRSAHPAAAKTDADWPGFRGAGRDSSVRGVRIDTDWSRHPPVALWRRPIGPGWSSFAVHGDLVYTQEQRGADEVVSCYNLKTGEPVWRHRDAARFWESNGGAGPRGTPTLSNGRVYTFGATGIVNALDASNGAVLWSRNAASEAAMKTPAWGFASSPLVVDDVVVVAVSGT